MNAILRQADEGDIDAIVQLVNAAYRPAPGGAGWTHEGHLVEGPRISPEKLRDLPGKRSVILVLETNEKIVACVHLKAEDDGTYLGMLATDPAEQAKGFGSKMLNVAEVYATDQFGSRRFCMTVLSSRPELLSFYERRGYVQTGRTTPYPPEDEVGEPRVQGLHLIGLEKWRPAG